jgi:putative PIN family toxin of toxin-antitoxin system
VRVVLDTGVVVSALLFASGRVGWLREAWTSGAIRALVSRPTTEELIRVLAYPKFRLSSEEVEIVLAAYLPFCETVTSRGGSSSRLPRCSDPADQEFLELAGRAHAEALVTGDHALLRLQSRTRFAILSPAELRERLPTRE